MKANILEENKMRELFTDHIQEQWYYCQELDDISFNLSIDKKNKTIKIDVLDEDFCQPYDYQYILNKNPNNEFAKKIHNFVQAEMLKLMEFGVIEDYVMGDYI